MSKEILKGIFEENIAPVREDITFEGWVDKIKDNEEYKVGLFENYVQPSMPDATFEDFNAETFGLGKVEAPLGGAQSEESVSPTESVSSEFEVGPPGVEPKGAPVEEAAALVGEVELEGEPTMMGQKLDPYTIVEEDDRNFFERLFGEERYRRVTERAVETVPALTRLFGKAAAKDVQEEVSDLGRAMDFDPEFVVKASQSGLFTTNNLATYLSQEAAGDKKGAEEINMFLEKGAEGKTTQFQRFKTLYAPIEKERNEAIQKELLSNRDYVALRGKIDAEFNRQRVGVDEKYDFKALMGEEFKVGEKELLDKYESATLALPMQLETKANELKFEYQAKVNSGQISVDEANAGLRRDLDAYGAELQKQSDKALEEYNSGVTALAERLEKGVKDKPEFKAYMDELNELRNGVVESFSNDYQKIQQSVFNNVAPKYNSKIETAITNSMRGETPLLDKSGVKGDIAKIVNNRGWDYLAFDQKRAALDTMFGTALSKLKRSGVEINDGVVANLRAEFDDAFMDRAYFTKKGTPSLFMVKTRAIEEAERLDEMLKEREAKTGTKTYTSGIYGSEFGVGGRGYDDTDVQELRLAREKLQEIIDMPETMSDSEWSNFWNGLTSGQFVDYLPFVSGLKNLSGTLALYRAVGKDTESARYLKNAEALNSTYQNMYEVNNIASDWYKAGKGTAQSLPFMMEFAATAGVGSGVRLGTEKVVVKLLGKQAETVVGKSLKVMAGTLISSLAQTTLNPQRYVDEALKRMTPQMTMAFSPEGDDLVAMLDSSDTEGGFEAALKGFGVTASEYFSEGLGFAGARAMKAVGSKMLQNEFLKRAYVGWYMSKFNFDTPTAFKKIAEMGGWNGFLMEFGEELANIPLTNLITGDAKVMEGIIKDGELDTENLADVARTLLPITLAGGAVSLSSLAIRKIVPEGVTVAYMDANNQEVTETINKGVWDAVTEVMKSPAKVRDFIANELPKLKVDGKGREIVTSMLERAAIEFDRGVVGAGTRQIAEATSPLEVTFEPIPETEKAPKVEIIIKRRQKLNRDRTKLVPTGGFDYFAKVGDKEVKLSDAEYKAYKESGVLPESVSAVEVTPEVEGEAVTPEAVAPEVSEEVVAEAVTSEVAQAPEVAEGKPTLKGEIITEKGNVLQRDFEGEKIRNDEGHRLYQIKNKEGEVLGTISLNERADLGGYQIEIASVLDKKKGIGKDAYKSLIRSLDKPLISDSSLTPGAKGLWESLVKDGVANFDKEKGKYISITQAPEAAEGQTAEGQPAEVVSPEVPALRDVESTAKALETVDKGDLEKALGEKLIHHGTGSDFSVLEESKQNSATGHGDFGKGFYFSLHKGNARYYSLKFDKAVRRVKSFLYSISSPFEINITNEVFDNNTKEALKKLKGLQSYEKDAILKNLDKDFGYKAITKEIGDARFSDILETNGFDAVWVNRTLGGETQKGAEIVVFNKDNVTELTNKTISESYHKAKEDGSNPELVSAVEELLGKPTQAPEVAEGQPTEVISPEVAEALSTEDATRIALESLEVLPKGIESAEEGARIYHEAIGKEELTDEEVAVVDFVEGNVAKVKGVSERVVEGAVEIAPEVETAVSPLQDVESTTKALEGVEQEKLNSVKEKISKAEISKFESDERKQTTTRADRGVQEVQPPSERDLGGREVSQPDRGFNSVSTGEEWERGEQYNGDGKVPSSNGKPVITVLYHGHKAPFDSFSREYRGSGIGNQGGGVYFLVRPSEALATAERVARFGGYGLNRKETANSTPFVSKVKIKGNNFVFLDKPIPKDIVAQIGVINGIDPSKYNTYSAFLYDLGMSFVTDKKNFTDHSEAQTKAADELYKKGITGHASSNIKDYEVAVYDESEIEKISQTRIYNSNAELISDQYHKAKADNSNPELVKAVEDLLGVTPEAVTPEVPGVAEVAEGQKKPSRVATFFSGAGTMEASLPNAQSVMAVEFNPEYIEAYNNAFGVEYKAKDVRDINPDEVIASKPDIFHASPVCKNFSAAKNKRTVLKSDMESADAVARVIREAQPPIVTIENVPDYQGTVPFETIIKALEDAGYTFDVGVYNSADFGGVQNRERLLIRAVKSGELPAIPEKTAPGDWYSAIEDLIESAPDSKFESRTESENWEMARIRDMVRKGKLDATKPIITMGGSASRGVAAAANAGGPAPTLLSTSRSVPRIILPDGTVKRVTPEMMRRLMGLPESYPIPSNPKVAKEVLGNGVDGAFTRALIDPLLNRAEGKVAEAPKPAEGLTSKEKAEKYKKEAEEIAKKIRKNFRGRGGITGITPFSRAKRLAEVDRETFLLVRKYIYTKVREAIELSKVYTFKDFVEDMKENSKRIFGVQINVADSDKSIFHSASSRFEIDDAFAQEILDLKQDFIFAIAAIPGRMNMNFQEFISSNSALVNGFVNRAESNYGLNQDQAMMLVQEMYQDALSAAASRAESYTTLEDVKKFHETKEELLALERDMERARINEEIKRRRNWLSRNFDKFKRAFITPVKNFNRAFEYRGGKLSDYRTSQERDVYSARKYRMGASTKANNWYNAIHKKIYGDLSWFEKVELDKYLIYRRIVEVTEIRNQRKADYKDLEDELAAGVDPVRKQEIKEAMAELEKVGMDEVKSGEIMVGGEKKPYDFMIAKTFVNDINGRNDALAIKIKERAKMHTDANNELLKMRLDAGLISQEAYKSMEKRDYVRRLFVDISNTTIDEANYSPVSKEIKAIKKGREDAILEMDTQALLQINAQITFDSVAKNKFVQKVVGWAETKQQQYLDKALEKFKDARARAERYLRSSPRPLTQDEIDRFIKEQTLFIPLSDDAKVPSGFTAQKYFVDGVEKRVAVRNDIANVFQTPSGRGVKENSFAIKALSAILLTPVIKASAVFVNPAFAIGNFALDVIHASMVTRDLYKSFTFNLGTILAKATGYTAENVYRKAVKFGASLFGRTARDSKFERLVKDYFEHGGGMSGLANPSSRMYSDKLSSSALRRSFGDAKDGIIAVLDVINSLQAGSELITRVIVYEAALEKNIAAYREKNGVDPVGEDLALMKMSAAASAADLIDFREGTETTKVLDQTILPFLNAMIQGAKAEIDFASKNPLLAAARLAEFGGMALGVALYNANSGDEDEKEGIVGYNGISEYIKSNYFIMMMPWTKKNERGEIVRPFISIKLPAALKATNIMITGMVADQGAKNTIGQMVSALEGGYVPEIGAVSPTAQIAMALSTNKDAFRKGAPIYRGRPDVLLTERFNAGETKAIYRDLFGAMYDLINEDGENEGVLGFDEAGPAQWQAAFEKAISPNNPYYLGITSTYAAISSLYGKENKREVDVLMDEKFAALNAFRSRVYREPNSSVQQKNIEDRKKIDFLRDQKGSWQKKNDDAIEFAAKTIRDFNNLDRDSRNFQIDLFFDRDVFGYISDDQMIKSAKAQGIKDIPENVDELQKIINKEQTRLSVRLVEEFKPRFIFKHPALKNYAQSEDAYFGLNAEMINKIAKEYDGARDRKAYLLALKFVAGDDFDSIVKQIGAHEKELSVVNGITTTKSAIKYKKSYLRADSRSSKPISSESAINNLILLRYLLQNE